MNQKLSFIFVLFCCFLFGQEQQTDCANTIKINHNAQNLRILKYPGNYRATKLNNFSDVQNNTPEALMQSVISATNIDWFNFNRDEKKEKSSQDFEYITSVKPDDYYAELLYKVSFNANGEKYCVVKYYLHDNGKDPIGYAEAMKQLNGKWTTTSSANITQLLFFMIMIDTKYIDAIFNNLNSDNDSLNQVINENSQNRNVNINSVLNELEKRLSENDENIMKLLDKNRLFK